MTLAEVRPNEAQEQELVAVNALDKCADHIREALKSLCFYHALIQECMQTDRDRAVAAYQILEKEQVRLAHVLSETRLPLLELEDTQAAAYAGVLQEQLMAFNLMTPDYSKLEEVLSAFADSLPSAPQKVSATTIGRLMNGVKMGFYPTDLKNVGYITKGLQFPTGITANLLDPCCGLGDAVKCLSSGGKSMTYGVELDDARAAQAQDRLDRVAFGSFFGSQISWNAFHVLFLNPPYLTVMGEGGSRSRDEKKFLVESLPRLMPGGVLIYIIPYYRLTQDICTILCDNFSDLSMWRFTEAEFKKFRQVAIFGAKKIRRESDPAAAAALEAMTFEPDSIPCITEISAGRYQIPAQEQKVALFKGAKFNELELARQLAKSKSFDQLFAKSTLDSIGRRPPLPLSISQIGLIGGSGMVNGLIDCEYPHIIKGRVVKVQRIQEEEFFSGRGDLSHVETRVTIANKMCFNVLTPDGFLSLA